MILTYKAGYKYLPDGVHAQVVDFPAVISCGDDLDDARQMLADALIDVAETLLELGQSLPTPNPSLTDAEMDVEEAISFLHH